MELALQLISNRLVPTFAVRSYFHSQPTLMYAPIARHITMVQPVGRLTGVENFADVVLSITPRITFSPFSIHYPCLDHTDGLYLVSPILRGKLRCSCQPDLVSSPQSKLDQLKAEVSHIPLRDLAHMLIDE